ncbi:MAG: histidine phosphatase family protein [Nanoarchaeota archaeon]|nr:histidine phosphatase family protein [Nanoarchaeota archaeon]
MVTSYIKNIIKNLRFIRYRFQYLINYIIIGLIAVGTEVIIAKYLLVYNIPFILKVIIGFIIGVTLGFILNARLNFHVPKSKNRRTFIIFLAIATIAFILNLGLIAVLREKIPLGYATLRFVTSAIIFMLSYTAHRNITFDFVKKVGIAVYLNKNKDINQIYSRIRYYADFVHIDLIDKSFNSSAPEIDLSLIKEINKAWVIKKILHIMSKNPSVWIKKLYKNVNSITFHIEIDENISDVIRLCRSLNKKVGLCLKTDSKIEDIIKYIPYIDFVQVMGIDELGKSGQIFNTESIEKVNRLNRFKKKYNFEIIFDGGVKPTNIGKINAKYIVSSSGILSSDDPITSFLELKTSSRYRNIENELRKDIIKKIRDLTENLDFIQSGNIVGSFSKYSGIEGINDVDIVLILDELSKDKFESVIKNFEKIKKEIESKYGYNVILNPSLGPLKFNKDNIVFHIMLYDIKSHIDHCIKSPFTCYDWQNSGIFFKKSMSELYKVYHLQPSNFFDSRRSSKEYLSEIKENKLSYRKYIIQKNKVIEKKDYKLMDSRDRIEFSYHIMRFLMSNLLKLYYRQNKDYDINEAMDAYFKIFPKNKELHKKFINDLIKIKKRRNYDSIKNILKHIEFFLSDYESQFKDYFYNSNKEIIFLRHVKTKAYENQFIGQKSNPELIYPDKKEINNLKNILSDYEIFFSSPSLRCKNTLSLLTEKNITLDNRLNEINYGELDGKDLDYLIKNYPKIIDEWEFGNDPKFPNGENQRDVLLRLYSFLKNIKNIKNNKIALCTHNVVLRCLIGSYLKIPMKEWYKLNIPDFEPIRFILTKNSRLYIELTDNQIKEILKNL